jgi:hypothetical protein
VIVGSVNITNHPCQLGIQKAHSHTVQSQKRH